MIRPYSLLLSLGVAFGGCSPNDYSACVLKYAPATSSSGATEAVLEACDRLHPSTSRQTFQLDPVAVQRIDGVGSVQQDGYFSATIYNGNTDVRLLRITIALVPPKDGSLPIRRYTALADIEPQSVGLVRIRVLGDAPPSDTTWAVMDAYGTATVQAQ